MDGSADIVAVAGMHRSGTSALARALVLLGLSPGDPARLMPATEDNPGGYWENLRVAQLHDELLGVLGGWWSAPPVLATGWEQDPALSPFWTWAAQLVQDHLEPFGRCLLKDPRLCFLLPLWRVLAPVQPVVAGLRHPDAVAASLATRDGFAPEHGAWLWLRHVHALAEEHPEALVVHYEDWFERPATTIDHLVAHVGLAEPDTATRAAVTDWIDPGLRRSAPVDAVGPFGAVARRVDDALRDGGLRAAPVDGAAWEGLPAGWRAAPPA